jgi:hypothetical protein
VIINRTLALKQRWSISAENIVFDRGGGGKQIADQLRQVGFNVRTVAFGEAVRPEPKVGMTNLDDRVHQDEQKYSYFNRRAELYGGLREIMDPSTGPGFALPARYTELRRQLAMMPLLYDREGRMRLPPSTGPVPGPAARRRASRRSSGTAPTRPTPWCWPCTPYVTGHSASRSVSPAASSGRFPRPLVMLGSHEACLLPCGRVGRSWTGGGLIMTRKIPIDVTLDPAVALVVAEGLVQVAELVLDPQVGDRCYTVTVCPGGPYEHRLVYESAAGAERAAGILRRLACLAIEGYLRALPYGHGGRLPRRPGPARGVPPGHAQAGAPHAG